MSLYIAVEKHEVIVEICRRIAECSNPEIFARNFVPPQFFQRYCALNQLCANMRAENSAVKTQLRFNKHDIEILTKRKGTPDPYRIFKLSEEERGKIPKFDHSLAWNRKTERPPRKFRGPMHIYFLYSVFNKISIYYI